MDTPAAGSGAKGSINPWPKLHQTAADADTAEFKVPAEVSAPRSQEAQAKPAEMKLADAKSAPAEEPEKADDAPAGHAAAHDSVEETPATVIQKVAGMATEPLKSVSKAGSAVGQCAACGFPVSEGRVLCVDCEKKSAANSRTKPAEAAVAASLFTMGSEAEAPGSWFRQHRTMVVAVGLVVAAVVAILLLR